MATSSMARGRSNSRGRMETRRPTELMISSDDEADTEQLHDDNDDDDDDQEAARRIRFDVDDDAADAHRQVMAMSSTIEILTRDFENLQRELLDAYKKLQEYSDHDPRLRGTNRSLSPTKVGTTIHGGIVSNAMAKLRSGNYEGDCACGHETDVHELQQIITVKDTALTEALQERNEYKLRMERAETMLRELHGTGTSSARGGTSSRAASFTSKGIPYGMTSTSPVHFTPSMVSSGSVSSAASSHDVPKHERFDQESTYQSQEDDELFWRRQYRDAVRMRKHHGQVPASAAGSGGLGHIGTSGAAKPSLKIFSYPNGHRQKGITDENVPFTRYIGISTRQNEIIKEQHRLLS